MKRDFRRFVCKEGIYNINSAVFEKVCSGIPRLWEELENHIRKYPEFRTSLVPSAIPADCPAFILQMYKAAALSGVGPMAAVAGTFSYESAKPFLSEADEIIVENGGDIFLKLSLPIVLGIYAGDSPLSGKLGIELKSEDTPLAVCSSSGKMGHSLSLGNCDLATVIAENASLADCAATRAANLVKEEADLESAAEAVISIPGIRAVILIKNDKIALAGKVPRIVRVNENEVEGKITIHPGYAKE